MAARKKNSPDLLELARENFGFHSFRKGQREAIEALQKGHDALVVMPTGSGKSAIYQIAALLFDGVTVVISPLIALQKDQVDAINAADAPEAVVINSTQKAAEAREAKEKIEEGESKYIFLAPEQFHRQETMELLNKSDVSLFVVDEAHCISEWGHDFRPDYLQLGPVVEQLGHPTLLAMTATASPDVRKEIVERLGMRKPKIFVHGFDRPNISLRVDHFEKESEKMDALVHRVHWADKPGIVYTATRKNAEAITHALIEEGQEALCYHGGLKATDRKDIQERFMSGEAPVIVATNAFGMGVDKSDVRFVYHYDISDSLDSYYQEIGRGGRDGEKAEAVLFYRAEDLGVRKFLAGEGKLDPEAFERVVDIIADQEGPVEPEEIADQVDLSQRKLTSVIQRLEDVGALETLPGGEVQVAEQVDPAEAARAAAEEQLRRKDMKRERLERMRTYAETSTCRREFLLCYFGDEFTGPCGNCDNCQAAQTSATETDASEVKDIEVDPAVGTRREVA